MLTITQQFVFLIAQIYFTKECHVHLHKSFDCKNNIVIFENSIFMYYKHILNSQIRKCYNINVIIIIYLFYF